MFDKIIDAASDHPYMVGGGVLLLVLLATRGGDSSAAPVQDYSASLASLGITTDANVKLAEISAQRDVAAAGIQRDIITAGMQLEGQNRMATTAATIAGFDTQRAAAEMTSFNALQTFQTALGFQASKKQLENESKSLTNQYALGVRSLDLQQFGISTQADVDKAAIAEAGATNRYSMDSMLKQAMIDLDSLKFSLPITTASAERINDRNRASEENYYWRQQKIVEKSGMFDIFGGLINAGTQLGMAAMTRGM